VSDTIHAAAPCVLLWCVWRYYRIKVFGNYNGQTVTWELHLVTFVRLNTYKLRPDINMSEVLSV
jgi:hypothetical protein